MTEKERKIASKLKYEQFRNKVRSILDESSEPLTWTEIRKEGNFKQKYPNNLWVRKMEEDIGLIRERTKGKMYWRLKN